MTGSRPVDALICITGMHRSGTSLTARVVNLLGVGLGADASLMGPGPDNPAGYWENRSVKELDDELLAHLGGSWDQPPVLTGDWATDPSLDPFRDRAATILRDDFPSDGAQGPVGCKEPRLSLLHPFWRTVAPISHTVVTVREPTEVVASLARRNGMDPGQAAALWLRYLCAATTEPAVLVRLDDLTDHTEDVARRLAADLDLPAPSDAVLEQVRAHHDPALLHRAGTSSASEGPASTPVLDLALDVWNDGDVDTGALPDALRGALAEGWLAPPASRAALDEARAENVALRESLRKWHRLRKRREQKHPERPLPPLPEVPGFDAEGEIDEP